MALVPLDEECLSYTLISHLVFSLLGPRPGRCPLVVASLLAAQPLTLCWFIWWNFSLLSLDVCQSLPPMRDTKNACVLPSSLLSSRV